MNEKALLLILLYYVSIDVIAAEIDLQHPPSGVIFGNMTWPGSGAVTVIGSALTFFAGSVLNIEAGAVLRFTSASAVIVVKGTIIAKGRPDARIVFDGVDMTSIALQISGMGGARVIVSHATFSNFGQAVNLENSGSSDGRSSLYFEDCVFERNGRVMDGFNADITLDFLRCEFSSNLRPLAVYGYYGRQAVRFDGCSFQSQVSGAFLMGGCEGTIVNCVFRNHTDYALSVESRSTISDSLFVSNSGVALTAYYLSTISDSRFVSNTGIALRTYQSTVRNCLFVSNDVGIQDQALSTIADSIFLMNRVGIAAREGARVDGGWICGRPLDNSSDLIILNSPRSMEVRNVWFGIPGEFESVIRGSIKDIYWQPGSGLAILMQISDRPSAWPASLQSYYATYASLCSTPQSRGLDLQHPPSGVIFGNDSTPSADAGFCPYIGLSLCQAGSYSVVSGSSTCMACSAGTFSTSTGECKQSFKNHI